MNSYNYWCPFRSEIESCDFCFSKGTSKGHLTIDSEIESFIEQEKESLVCPNNNDVELKLEGRNTHMSVGERFKHRPKEDAQKRSIDHFKKEIYPNIDGFERKHFAKKHNLKQ